jgi:1-acyl-sn-glycerol-3-phosphate acyltransferase
MTKKNDRPPGGRGTSGKSTAATSAGAKSSPRRRRRSGKPRPPPTKAAPPTRPTNERPARPERTREEPAIAAASRVARPTTPSSPSDPVPGASVPLSAHPMASEPVPGASLPLGTRPMPSEPPLSATESSRLRVLEQRLGQITRPSAPPEDEPGPASIREQVSSAAREVVDRLAAPVSRVDETNVVDAVRDLLSSDYYLRQWGRLGMRNRSEEVDDFGLDTVYEARLKPIADFLYERYFRVEADGIENVPAAGRCLVVANHSGTLPLDGLMLRTCMRHAHPAARELRWLTEDFVYYLPFVGAFMSRVGGVRACPENAERLLNKESLVAVFPEGVKGIGKLYRDRYQLQRFGRGGFIRLCLRTGTPLVPAAVIGAEEANPMLHRDELLSKVLGLPYLPVTPTFPFLGPLGLLPAPTKWRIRFGEIVRFDDYGPEAAEDPVLVGRLADSVRAGIQQMLDGGLAERKSVWFG